MVLRSEKGEALTHEELDGNFTELYETATLRNKNTLTESGTFEGDFSISLFDIGDADLVGVNLSTPIAYVSIKGKLEYLVDDGYGELIDDGYGNPTISTKEFDTVFGVFVDDDGYGNFTIRNQPPQYFVQEDEESEAVYTIQGTSTEYKGFYSIDVSVLPTIDFQDVGIEVDVSL